MLLGGRYRVEDELGRGGMAKVFKGTDEVLGRPVAIKVLAPQLADDESFVARFRREAQAAARLNHSNLVGVYDTGEDDGIKYIVMEYVEGKTLAAYLAGGGRIMPDRAMEIAEGVCSALAVAHAAGIVHRDIKPGNIMVTPRGEVKVTDFGIARVSTTGDTVAQTVAVLGTASYLSPEQAQGQAVDGRSDIYSLGCVLYEMLAGRPPFAGDSPVTVASKQVLETPQPPSKLNPDVSTELDAVILKTLAKNPANRYQTADELRADLERARRGEPVIATPLLAEAAATQAMPPAAQTTAVLPPTQPTGGGRRWWVGVLVAVLILGVLGAGGYFLATALLGGQVKQVKVPSVTGFLQAQAESTLVNAGFVPKVDTKVVDDPAQVGFVQEQNPPANELADEGSTVTITVGRAPKQVPVPNVVGMIEADARAAIETAKLTIGTVTPQASATAPSDQVIGQDPPADTLVNPGTPVNLVVSSGPAAVTVPDLTCFSYGKAKSTLAAAGFGIELAGEMPANPLCPNGNKIVQQDPAANSQANQGTAVQVWVGTKASPSPTSTP
jgi:serine/threonine-protein kinase